MRKLIYRKHCLGDRFGAKVMISRLENPYYLTQCSCCGTILPMAMEKLAKSGDKCICLGQYLRMTDKIKTRFKDVIKLAPGIIIRITEVKPKENKTARVVDTYTPDDRQHLFDFTTKYLAMSWR